MSQPHPNRDTQFRFIDEKARSFIDRGLPVISIDCKKKELIGNFKNPGQEYGERGKPRPVLDHDFELKELGKVAPYGIYVLNNNTSFVNLGLSSDTAEFASESWARWWHYGGGSNGYRNRLWKWLLAVVAESYGLTIHVSHLPPGTLKWNKIEHRLFCYISKNWAGQPLTSIETVVELIGSTTTTTGLKVRCDVDRNQYKRGIQISDEELESIYMEPVGEFGQWNYIVRGFKAK